MYFPMKVAVARLGGPLQAAIDLNVTEAAVTSWLSPSLRSRPEPYILRKLSAKSKVSSRCFQLYFKRLEVYKSTEKFRRV